MDSKRGAPAFAWDAAAMGEAPAEADAAIRAVAEALDLARERAGAAVVNHKHGRDIVTADDVRIEDQVRADLSDALGHAVVGEERGGEAIDHGVFWMLDPICGTRNYASGIPLYVTNLALVREGEPVLAVVGDASTDELLVAMAGGGAWSLERDGGVRRIRADAGNQTAIVEPGKSNDARRDGAARFFAAVVRTDRWDLMSLNSTTSLAYVAAGRASAYVCFYVTSVHTAAGVLLAKEAGATVTDVDGAPWTLASDSLLAAATLDLHADLLALR